MTPVALSQFAGGVFWHFLTTLPAFRSLNHYKRTDLNEPTHTSHNHARCESQLDAIGSIQHD
jgi:hypothetical protein